MNDLEASAAWASIARGEAKELREMALKFAAKAEGVEPNHDDPRLSVWFDSVIASRFADALDSVANIHEAEAIGSSVAEHDVMDALGRFLSARRSEQYIPSDGTLQRLVKNARSKLHVILDCAASIVARLGLDPAPLLHERFSPTDKTLTDVDALLTRWVNRPIVNAPTSGTSSANPLLVAPQIHPSLHPAFDALVAVVCQSASVMFSYRQLAEQQEREGPPRPSDWRNVAESETDPAIPGVIDARWTRLMREWVADYRGWCAALDAAKQCVQSPAVAAIMDAGEARPAHKWTSLVRQDLDALAGSLHPMQLGKDGLGMIRGGLKPLPEALEALVKVVDARKAELRAETLSTVVVSERVSTVDHSQLAALVAAKVASLASVQSDANIGGTDNGWQDIQGRLLAKRERDEPYTSLRALSVEMTCSTGVISKAIKKSQSLRGWKARRVKPKAAPKATDLGTVVRSNKGQTTEAKPGSIPLDDSEAERLLKDLAKQEMTDSQRAELEALPPDKKRALAIIYRDSGYEVEKSPLEPDKVGERPRKVREYKRA